MKRATRTRGVWRVGAWITAIGLVTSAAAYPPAAQSWPGRKGATVLIFRGAEVVKGELIGVRADVIVVSSEKRENAIPLADIDRIKILRGINQTSTALGGVVGLMTGLIIGAPAKSYNAIGDAAAAPLHWVLIGSAGALAGCFVGAFAGAIFTKDEVMELKGRPKADIDTALKRLKKKARVQNYQ
jgi:hypothetical protein